MLVVAASFVCINCKKEKKNSPKACEGQLAKIVHFCKTKVSLCSSFRFI